MRGSCLVCTALTVEAIPVPGQTNHSLSRSAASLLAPAPTLVRTPLFVHRASVQGPFVGVAPRQNSPKQART
ncbi:uncharacterized protein TRAVEDRAFT_28432 [Trametes versicolor FP-101664 SS1]|uniref:uncharacterized protein n=1 Tax=Trametes versicolor (strain FP-101664) TaxID=717944 RepID=UPI000462295F|nr:uncharacterized protein TRAVEDRAFT_28432 [Trametes versicolor FP-101664 SS1]EIW59083.1 hypothetical protein TRAVEDRAFT_28432 [Trametes versicolor FP-101664 SS1]